MESVLDDDNNIEKLCAAEYKSPNEVMTLIEMQIVHLLECVNNKENCKFELVKRKRENMKFINKQMRLGEGIRIISTESCTEPQIRAYSNFWKLLAYIYTLLKENKKATQRDIYYCLIKSFKDQKELNESIQDLVSLLKCTRSSLNIITSSKGLIVGRVMLKEHGNWIDCCKVGVQGHNITDETASNIQLHPSGVRYILVIEKEGIFNRLSEDKFFNIIPCVIVTARGYPDLNTRKIVKKLQDVLQVPVLGLVGICCRVSILSFNTHCCCAFRL